MAVGIEGRRQRRGFLHWVFEVFSLVSRFEQLKVAGSARSIGAWFSRFSHLMAVAIEGRSQRGAVVHGFRGFIV